MAPCTGLRLAAAAAAVSVSHGSAQGGRKVMNDGGVPYTISNPADSAGSYSADFSGLGDYFDVYGEIRTRYSQVYWTRNDPVPLPEDIVRRFDGKVMAITGYEADQVMKTPEGDKSIPIYNAYNHHYFAWLTGKDSEMIRHDKPRLLPNPTHWQARAKEGTQNGGYPTNIVFKENPGGEYRKSYHGYPEGFAQLIHSPNEFVLEPMQIDTHNRAASPSATNVTGYQPWFLPKMEKGKNDPRSGLSPLIECPCSDRIAKTEEMSSPMLVAGVCQKPLTTAKACDAAVADIAPSTTPVSTVDDPTLPAGCIMVPSKKSSAGGPPYSPVFNTAKSSVQCGNSEAATGPMAGTVASLNKLSIAHDGKEATITITGPADVWFGIGFNAATMADKPYAIIVDGSGAVTERKLDNHAPGALLNTSVTVVSNTVAANVRTVVLSRPVAGASAEHFSLPTSPEVLNVIMAQGTGIALAYHRNRTGAKISMLPTEHDTCMCEPTATSYITYMNTTKFVYATDCEPWPRGDMAMQHNPACHGQTYHGGLQCCKHGWFLTDMEQDSLIPSAEDVYYLKFRFYYQEFVPATATAPASHKHLSHWVFLIDANVNDYEEVQCADGTMCEASITAHLTAREMGIEDVPANLTGITPMVMTPHCHAPSCLREEFYNADTGDLICGVEARYGTGIEVFNERDYIALSPCLFGNQPGLRKPVTLTPDTNIRAIKVFNNTFRHLGQMAQWTGLVVYEFGEQPSAEAPRSGPKEHFMSASPRKKLQSFV